MSSLTDLDNWAPEIVSTSSELPAEGLTEDEVYELLAGLALGEQLPLIAAANEGHTGAMVALVPSDADLERLAVDGGEDAEQLHLTLAFLGEAAKISRSARGNIYKISRRYVKTPVTAEAFSINAFNPGGGSEGKDTCVVLGVGNDGGEGLARVRSNIVSALSGLSGFSMPEQHTPWVPHVTLAYTDDLTKMAEWANRVGPITFDKLRVAFGDEVEDFPLEQEVTVTDNPTAQTFDDEEQLIMVSAAIAGDIMHALASDRNLRNYWTHGGGAAKIRWGTDGSFDRCVRHLRKYVTRPQGLCAEYHKEATGEWPAEKGIESAMETAAVETDVFGRKWTPDDEKKHPRGHGGRWTGKGSGKVVSPEVKNYAERLKRIAADDPDNSDRRIAIRIKNLDRNELGELADALGYDEDRDEIHGTTKQIAQKITNLIKRDSSKGSKRRKTNAVGDMLTAANDSDEPYGDVKYADPGYQADGVKRYPIDTPTHVRAAWSYINMPKNASKYSSDDLKKIKNRIQKAMSDIGAEVEATLTAAKKTDDVHGDQAWEGVLTVEGVESGDGRLFSLGSLDWASLPLPLMYQPANVGGHNASIHAGDITHAARRGNEIYGWGVIFGEALSGEHGAGIRRMLGSKDKPTSAGVSVDVDSVKDADVEYVYADGDEGGFMSKPETTIFHRGRIRGATLVAFPAFTEAKLSFTNEAFTASVDCGCADDDEPQVLTAAGHTITIPDLPPAAWFERPTDVKMHGQLTVTDEGRVFGRLGPAGVTHRSVKRKVPMRTVDYTRWMGGETIVEGGRRVVTGVITANCGHAPTEYYGTLENRREHYDNSCSVVANVRIGEDSDGVWVAGALKHGVTSEQVASMLGCRLSGDWQPHPDRPGVTEFIAALLVPVPGFAQARALPSVQFSDGMLVASSVPVTFGEPDYVDTDALDALNTAKRIIAANLGLDPQTRRRELAAELGLEV